MRLEDIENLFRFNFAKSATEIKERCTQKIDALQAKIKEREGRIARIREENKITDSALIEILTQARQALQLNQQVHSYSFSNKADTPIAGKTNLTEETINIPAGVVNGLLAEKDFVESEKQQVEKLGLIVRNLKDPVLDGGIIGQWKLSYEELRYLGF